MEHLEILERQGAMRWRPEQHAWNADPVEVMEALGQDGFQEYRREVARDGRAHVPGGGMWQGLDPRTGTVATVIWVAHAPPPYVDVFIEIEGEWVEGRTSRTPVVWPAYGSAELMRRAS